MLTFLIPLLVLSAVSALEPIPTECAYVVSRMRALGRVGYCRASSPCSSTCIKYAKTILAVPSDEEYGCYRKANMAASMFSETPMNKHDVQRKQTEAIKNLKKCNETVPAEPIPNECANVLSKMRALQHVGICDTSSPCSSTCIKYANTILAVPADEEYDCYGLANFGDGMFPTRPMNKFDVQSKQTEATKNLKKCNKTVPALATSPPASTIIKLN